MEARVAEVRADGARRSKGIRSFEKFPVSRDALDKFEPGGEPSSPKFLIGARVNEEGQTWFSFERCCIETCASYFHPVIVFLFSLSFYSPRFLTFLLLSSQEKKSLFVSDGWMFSRDRDGCQLGSHCPATNSLESART